MSKKKNKKPKVSKKGKSVVIEITIDLDAAMGKAFREQYLKDNPHGFVAVKKIHKNKKKYNRNEKHK